MKFEYVFRYYKKDYYALAIKTDDFELFTTLQSVINNAITKNEEQDSMEKTATKKSKNCTKE